MVLRALVLDCSLAPTPSAEACEGLTQGVLAALSDLGVEGSTIRVFEHDVRLDDPAPPDGADDWPSICEQVMAADIVVVGASWSGQQGGSECRAVLDRLGTAPAVDETARLALREKVAVGVVVGRGEGAHQAGDVLAQRLGEAGFALPDQGVRCWDVRDLDRAAGSRGTTQAATEELAATAARFAARLKGARRSPV